ncbi:hypothetical protein LR090_03200 [Candidatus Bipolaricaulota bacterium]|nr:hypothetical protein [Candidatus Bipolaricaulota bacterium]
MAADRFPRDRMYYKFRLYGFLKNLRFFDPFLILFLREMGLSFLEIGSLFSIREIAINVLEVPTGVIADSFGRRKAMLASFSSYILSFLMFYLFPGFLPYSLAMLLFACGETFRSGTHKAMILEYLRLKGIEHLKVDYYGHTRAGSQLGSAFGALIAAGLVLYSGSYRMRFSGLTRAVNLSYLVGLGMLAGAGVAAQFELYPLAVLAPAVGALADRLGVGLALVAGAGMMLTPLLQVRERR